MHCKNGEDEGLFNRTNKGGKWDVYATTSSSSRGVQRLKTGDFVFCIWLDAVSEDDWTGIDNIKDDPVPIWTVGILIKKTKQKYVIALNKDTVNDNISCFITIPIKMVVKIKKLNP